MGRWSYSSRMTVDQCKSIPMTFLKKQGYLERGYKSGNINWTIRGEKCGNIGIAVEINQTEGYFRARYNIRQNGEREDFDYKVRLVSTPCNYGGRRWWFICPISIRGALCQRRVGVLHFGGSKYLGCRHCHDLTYESCRESHKFDRMFRSLGITPKEANRLLKSGDFPF